MSLGLRKQEFRPTFRPVVTPLSVCKGGLTVSKYPDIANHVDRPTRTRYLRVLLSELGPVFEEPFRKGNLAEWTNFIVG